jgi:hypothetical protein
MSALNLVAQSYQGRGLVTPRRQQRLRTTAKQVTSPGKERNSLTLSTVLTVAPSGWQAR